MQHYETDLQGFSENTGEICTPGGACGSAPGRRLGVWSVGPGVFQIMQSGPGVNDDTFGKDGSVWPVFAGPRTGIFHIMQMGLRGIAPVSGRMAAFRRCARD